MWLVTIAAFLFTLSVANAYSLRDFVRLRSLKKNGNLPVAVFHGITDACSKTDHLVALLSQYLNTYVVCIESGADILSVMQSINQQGQNACDGINKDPNFQGDFSIVGVSQGSLIGRYVMQKCQMKGTVKRYIGIGGPQMGVSGYPNCHDDTWPCYILDRFIDIAYYWQLAQELVSPCGYWKDPKNYDRFIKHSSFLADLNNERPVKNQTYVNIWKNLDKVLLVQFDADMMVQPRESAHFEFWNSTGQIVPLEESDFYKSDYLGIRYLAENQRLQKIILPGPHLHFTDDDVRNYFVPILSS